ncbi:transporter substrate-binding domain-containing protein [Roseateles asaccharophilus]|uniref:Polar amino acid transport system substrate-binding protein n=1 Tax=Roseateles asaccharophilus TaxID=582607 RepID=A0ABU2A1I0_9BURK|nr:transporter substrate-binding domain-containing protein [Roseateles asaccharophilus]MDR7331031.1 polar amino acid transport system substrate-binding protein [Roseateles asaccharophilus]
MKRRHCLAACALLAEPVGGQALRPLAIGFDEGSPPTMYSVGGMPAARGIYPAVVAAAFASLGLECELQALPFKRMLSAVDASHMWAGAVIRTPEREQRWLFSQPYFLEKLAVFSGGAPYRGIADLGGKRVGVIRGWSYGDEFDGGRRRGDFLCEEVASDSLNFAKLLRGRLDYVVATELGGRLLARAPAYAGRVVESPVPLGATPIHLAAHRLQESVAALLAQFNAAAERLHREGRIEALVRREMASAAALLP